MESIQQRNQQILQMREAGESRSELAKRFGVSYDLIAAIEKRNQAESLMREKRSKIREELRLADDPDKRWPIEDVLDAMNLGVLFRRRLTDHFKKSVRTEMSWRELMDLAVCDAEGCFDVPLVKIYGIGKIGLIRVVGQLSEIDAGPNCSAIWTEKRAALKRNWRM